MKANVPRSILLGLVCSVAAGWSVGIVGCGGRTVGGKLKDASIPDDGFFDASLDDSSGPVCGNGRQESGEECDGPDVGGRACADVTSFLHGSLTCTDRCTFDTSNCHTCGDDIVEGPEDCDGADLRGQSCQSQGYPIGGTLACRPNCTYDVSACCGDGTVGVGEECDDGNPVDWDGCTACLITEFQLSPSTQENQCFPVVSTALDGRFVVVWLPDIGGGVVGRVFDSHGTPIGAQFQAGISTAPAPDNSVSWTSNGEFVVVWSGFAGDGEGDDVLAQRYDFTGNPLGPELFVNSYVDGCQWMSSLSGASDGRFVVVWNNQDQGNDIFAQRYDANGNQVGPQVQVNSWTQGIQHLPSVSMGSDGTFVVVWEGQSGGSTGYDIFGQRFDADGVPAGPEFQVNSWSQDGQYQPTVSMGLDGRFVVVWQSNFQDGDNLGVFGQRFSPTGNPVGPEFQVNSFTQGYQRGARVSMGLDGRFVVVWQSDLQDGDGWGVFGQRYDATGNPLGPEFHVNCYTQDDQHRPSVSMTQDGSFVVVWQSYGQNGSDSRIFAQRYNANGEPRGVLPW